MPLYIPILSTNSLFYGLPKYSIHRLQRIQNTTARIVTRTFCLTHIKPILKSLHWLPVLYCINFKISCLTHLAISLGEPYYLYSLLSNKLNSHSLCSIFFNHLVAPCFKKVYNSIRSLMLHFFFGTIYLIPFVLLPCICLLEKT